MIIRILLPATILLLSVLANYSQNSASPQIPDAAMKGVLHFTDGKSSTTLERLSDKRVIVVLFEPWCGPCWMQAESLEKLRNETCGKGFTIIGLSGEDSPMEKAELRRTIKKLGYKFEFAWTDKATLESLMSITRISAIPQTFLIANGKLEAYFMGGSARHFENISKHVKEKWAGKE